MKAITAVATALVLVGALNWGLIALAEFDLVAWVFGLEFGETNAVTRVVYGLVGLSAIVVATSLAGFRARAQAPAGAATRA
jgi:uncharacterized protein